MDLPIVHHIHSPLLNPLVARCLAWVGKHTILCPIACGNTRGCPWPLFKICQWLRKTSFRAFLRELVTFPRVHRGNVTRARTNPGRERETNLYEEARDNAYWRHLLRGHPLHALPLPGHTRSKSFCKRFLAFYKTS